MLDARADGEGLLHERDAARQKRFERIAGAVADGEHDGFGGQLVPALRVFIANGGDAAVPVQHLRQARAETHFAAQFENPHAHGLDHAAELVRADVRLCVDQDVMRRAEAHEGAQDVLAARILRAGVELSVGKRACAALAELHVGSGGKRLRAARPVSANVAGARIDVLTAFEHDGARARFGQRQRGKQTGGAETDDDRANGGRVGKRRCGGRRIGDGQTADRGREPRGNPLFILRIFERHIERDDEADVAFFARIDAFFADFAMRDGALGDAERFGGRLRKRLAGIREREFYVMESEHGVPPKIKR